MFYVPLLFSYILISMYSLFSYVLICIHCFCIVFLSPGMQNKQKSESKDKKPGDKDKKDDDEVICIFISWW